MNLNRLTGIRINETSAKKRHRYIMVITDAVSNGIVFICKGKDKDVVSEFVKWLKNHNGHPENITVVASDFEKNFIAGVREHLPNAEGVYDPSHLIQLVNKKMNADRAANQVNGGRLKTIRYALPKNPNNLSDEERNTLLDIKKDNEVVVASYAMKESLRQMYESPPKLAREHLTRWIQWVEGDGSKKFKALAKTVKQHFDGIIRAIETEINNEYQKGLNAKIQLTKRLANGYHKRDRLIRMVFFRDSCRSYEQASRTSFVLLSFHTFFNRLSLYT